MGKDQVGEWVRQAQGGDRAAFGCLVGEFQDLINAVCLGHLGDPERARDAAQDTFVTALGAIKSLREPRAFVAWLLKLARTACRRQRTRWEAELPADMAGPAPERPREADAVVLVRAGLAALRPPDRMVLALAYLGGYSQPEIAEFLGVPVSTVKKRAFDARRRLRGALPMVEASLEAQVEAACPAAPSSAIPSFSTPPSTGPTPPPWPSWWQRTLPWWRRKKSGRWTTDAPPVSPGPAGPPRSSGPPRPATWTSWMC